MRDEYHDTIKTEIYEHMTILELCFAEGVWSKMCQYEVYI